MSENLKEWIKDILCAVVIAGIILFFFMPTIVREHSMENTLNESDYLFVSRQAYTIFGKPQRGDVVVFKSSLQDENGDAKLLVKRIIAVGGDTIEIKSGCVYLNDELIEEDYIKDGYTSGTVEKVTVPEGYLFCMGDNRVVSLDSRYDSVGFVSESALKGKVIFRLFPFNAIGSIK